MLAPDIRAVLALAIAASSLAMLAWNKVRYDVVGVAAMLALILFGVLSPSTALEGFISPAVIVIGSMMVIGGALADSGSLEVLGDLVVRKLKNEVLALGVLLLLVSLISGFVSDVALTVAFAPVMYSISSRLKKPISKYLLPLAYAAILGGRYTMIGTSPNVIIQSEWYQKFGYYLPLFAFARVGLLEVLVGIAALVVISIVVMRPRAQAASLGRLAVANFVMEAKVGEQLDGVRVKQLEGSLGIRVLQVRPAHLLSTLPWRMLRKDDIVILEVPHDKLPIITSTSGLQLAPGSLKPTSEAALHELLVTGYSRLAGHTLPEIRAEEAYGVSVIGIASGTTLYSLEGYRIRPGDVLLVSGDEGKVAEMAGGLGLMPLGGEPPKAFNYKRLRAGLLGIVAAVGLSAAGLNIGFSFLLGVLITVMLAPGLLRKAYEYVNWPILIFVGSYLSIGYALVATGISNYIAMATFGSPIALFAIAAAMSNAFGNVATASLLAPVALAMPNPLQSSVALAMGASSTFLTPFSHQANLVVQSAAGYSPRDYAKAGSFMVAVIAVLTALYLLGVL